MSAVEDLHAQFAPSVLHAEIDRLRAELAVAQERNSELLPIAAQCVRAVCHEHAVSRLERAEAAIDRVRELCAAHAGDDDVPRANVLAAIEEGARP